MRIRIARPFHQPGDGAFWPRIQEWTHGKFRAEAARQFVLRRHRNLEVVEAELLHEGDVRKIKENAKAEFVGLAVRRRQRFQNHRDRLCVVQLSGGDGNAHLVQFAPGEYDAPNLKKILENKRVTKIFHFARFDYAIDTTYEAGIVLTGTEVKSLRAGRANIADAFIKITPKGVMLYHADHRWLTGGFLGVEVFFVISGYLITMLLLSEKERTGKVSLRQFWLRRARRLLPALYVMMASLAIYMAFFRQRPMGQTRGDLVAGLFYVSNWFQVWVGQSYTAVEAFAPLRHLWSLAVEEQYYLFWPLVIALLLRRKGDRLPRVDVERGPPDPYAGLPEERELEARPLADTPLPAALDLQGRLSRLTGII